MATRDKKEEKPVTPALTATDKKLIKELADDKTKKKLTHQIIKK